MIIDICQKLVFSDYLIVTFNNCKTLQKLKHVFAI